jgi:hypothetical protein
MKINIQIDKQEWSVIKIKAKMSSKSKIGKDFKLKNYELFNDN